ncbi:MAG: hypothetical protein QM315_01570, partial [Bacillota bacterium]|nr:hypothetical protein [Bacillota bacterium]
PESPAVYLVIYMYSTIVRKDNFWTLFPRVLLRVFRFLALFLYKSCDFDIIHLNYEINKEGNV